jgi:hypothetical protein
MAGEHEGTYTSTVSGMTPNPSGTLYISKAGTPPVDTFSYTPTSTNANQQISPNSHGQTLTFSININGTTFNFSGQFTPTAGGNNKHYNGSVNDNSPKAQVGTWQATSTTPVPKPVETPRKVS